jgi:hypothetical protein
MSSIVTDLADVLGTIDRRGDFFAHGSAEVIVPRLEVDGVGPIALPLLPVQAEQLIAVAERAPYGRGEDTLTDVSVRRTWQIAPEHVRIIGRPWPETLETILVHVAEGLGVTGPVQAELYKLLVYDQGSFFVRHRDTEKQPGMFATLVLVLPSLSEGGELVVRHKDREARLSLRGEDPSEIAFAAFYADCVHEVLPVVSGYRLALVYNLMRRGPGPVPEAADHDRQESVVERLLRSWAESPRSPGDHGIEKVIYPLEHAYTPAELGFHALKGADAGVARVVVAAAERAGCDVHLALITVEESGPADYVDHRGGGARRGEDDEEDDEYDVEFDDDETDEFEAVEVAERSVTASRWCRPGGEPSSLPEIPVWDEELCPPEAFEDLDPDEEHFQEATGNEGASFERSYFRAALVVWPHEWLFAVINHAGVEVTLPYLSDLIERWQNSGEDHASPLWRRAHDFALEVVASWRGGHWYPRKDDVHSDVGRMLELLTRLEDTANLETSLVALAARGGFDLGDAVPIVGAMRLLPPERAAPLLTPIIAGATGSALSACGALLARGVTLRPEVLYDGAKALVDALPCTLAPDRWRAGPDVNPGFIVDLFTGLTQIDTALADRAATHVLAWPETFDFDTILIPAMRDLAGSDTSDSVRQLRIACVAYLEARIVRPLLPPRDWGRPNALTCACRDCAALGRFLADPVNARWVFKANEAQRGHVEATIRHSRCDVDARTDRHGRPFSLICTKNQASYERHRTQRAGDLVDLDRLKEGLS